MKSKHFKHFVTCLFAIMLASTLILTGCGPWPWEDETEASTTPSELTDHLLMIITPEEFMSAVQPLLSHKAEVGISAEAVMLEDIYASYTGEDKPEQIKRCIMYHYENYGTRYVMLVGDSDKFPVRYCAKAVENGDDPKDVTFVASDLYYAELYGEFKVSNFIKTWNYSKGGGRSLWYYGELHMDGRVNYDAIDGFANVAVGRIPASTEAEVTRYVNKVISYESNPPSSNDVLLALADGSYNDKDAADLTADLIIEFNDRGFNVNPLFLDQFAVSSTPPSITDLTASISNASFVNILANGDYQGWQDFYNRDYLKLLFNAGNLPVVFSSASDVARFAPKEGSPHLAIDGAEYPGRTGPTYQPLPPDPIQPSKYDLDSIAEDLLVKNHNFTNNGAIAFVGSVTDTEIYGLELCEYFFEAYLLNDIKTVGQMWRLAINQYFAVHDPQSTTQLELLTPMVYMLFGDPSLRITIEDEEPKKYHPVHLRLVSQEDVNEVWFWGGRQGIVIDYTDEWGSLVTSDLIPCNPNPPESANEYLSGPAYNTYDTEIIVPIEQWHDPLTEPDPNPYWHFIYNQQLVPLQCPGPIERFATVGFAPGVNQLGQGWMLLRDTMVINNNNNELTGFTNGRWEQVYRGPDGQLYVYLPHYDPDSLYELYRHPSNGWRANKYYGEYGPWLLEEVESYMKSNTDDGWSIYTTSDWEWEYYY